jgi:hypothetical protein
MPSQLTIKVNDLRVMPDPLSSKSDIKNRILVQVAAPLQADGTPLTDSVTFHGTDGTALDATAIAAIGNGGYLLKDKPLAIQPGKDLTLQLHFFKDVPVPAKFLEAFFEAGLGLVTAGWAKIVASLLKSNSSLKLPDNYSIALGYQEIVIKAADLGNPIQIELQAPQEEKSFAFEPGADKPTWETIAAKGTVTLMGHITVQTV